jgi:tetratricopeptide (TPR) repeat protein
MDGFRKRVEVNPNDAEAWLLLAWGHLRAGRQVDAEECAGKAVALGSDDWRLDILRGQIAFKGGRKNRALEFYESAWKKGGVEFTSLMQGAAVAAEKEDFEKAKTLYAKAKAAYPRSASPEQSPHLNLAKILRAEEKVDLAMAEVKAYLEINESEVGLRKEAATWHEKKGEKDAAMRLLMDVVRIDPYDRQVHARLADHYLEAKRGKEAERECRVAIELAPGPEEEAEIRTKLAKALLLLEKREDAVYQLEKALELDPGNKAARETLDSLKDD